MHMRWTTKTEEEGKKPQDYREIPFLNTHTKTAVSDKNVLGKRKL